MGLGRCRVRITGWHNPDDNELPTDCLPWAYPIMPITSASIGGKGTSPVGPQINTRVFGFFADGETGQQPIMIGTVPGINVKQTYKTLPYGAPPQQPVTDQLFCPASPGPFTKQRDCPEGNASAPVSQSDSIIPQANQSNAVSSTPVDPRTIVVNQNEWVYPATGFIYSAYGERSGHHLGVDICPAPFYQQTDAGAAHLGGKLVGPVGNPVLAAAAGEVIYLFKDGGSSYDVNGTGEQSFGNAIVIQHHLSDGPYVTVYAHLGLSQDPSLDGGGRGILVQVGDKVTAGQRIGTMGRTHNYEEDTHLHFEIRKGTSLPKSPNHINPGIIFPQMAQRHTSYRSWMAGKKYTQIPPFKIADAPCIAGKKPEPR